MKLHFPHTRPDGATVQAAASLRTDDVDRLLNAVELASQLPHETYVPLGKYATLVVRHADDAGVLVMLRNADTGHKLSAPLPQPQMKRLMGAHA